MKSHPSPRSRGPLGPVALAVVAFVLTPVAHAAMLSDTFDDGDRSSTPAGLDWYAINGTSGGAPKPRPTVDDDSAGLMAGNALFVEARGSGGEVMAPFGQPIAIGPATGDSVTVSFDMRLNGSIDPTGFFRFGLYQDTDGELGTGGWGTGDGFFDRSNPGAAGDLGVFASIPLQANGDGARINDELNIDSVMGGTDGDFIARPDAGLFFGLDDELKRSISLAVVRTGPGDNDLEFTLSVDGVSFGGSDSNNLQSSALSYDYFAAVTTRDVDWVIDNFRVVAVPEPSATVLAAIGLGSLARRRR